MDKYILLFNYLKVETLFFLRPLYAHSSYDF